MSILIIPEIIEEVRMKREILQIEENLFKILKETSIANMLSLSVAAPQPEEDEELTSLDLLTRGYYVLSQSEFFFSFDVYIGFLLKEDFPEVDTIIYTSPAAKEIFETRFKEDTLPKAKETIVVDGEMIVENEVYKRTVKYNRGSGE